MVKTLMIVILGLFGIIYLLGATNSSTSSDYTSEYGRCKTSAETKFLIQSYRAQYPSISDNQIAHILCDKK